MISNLMPSCRSCNHYKSTFTLDEFREQLMTMRERLNKQHKIYSISKRYRLIEEKPNKIVFENQELIVVLEMTWHAKKKNKNQKMKNQMK